MLLIPAGYQRLGGASLAAAATTTGAVAIPARARLFVIVGVRSTSSADLLGLRFNGDGGANYTTDAPAVAAGSTTWNATGDAASDTISRTIVSTAFSRIAFYSIHNPANATKTIVTRGVFGTAAAGTATTVSIRANEWINSTAQITSIELRTLGGTVTLGANSGFTVFGSDF